MNNIFLVTDSGLYDFELTALRKHTRKLGDVVSIPTVRLPSARVDHADLIIYFDRSAAHFYSHICINLDMVNHAALMSRKNIEVLLLTKSGNPSEVVYRVWRVNNLSITENGQLDEVWYAFHSHETGPSRGIEGQGFNSIDWPEFERRYILRDKSL